MGRRAYRVTVYQYLLTNHDHVSEDLDLICKSLKGRKRLTVGRFKEADIGHNLKRSNN